MLFPSRLLRAGPLLAVFSSFAYSEGEPPHPVVDIPRTEVLSEESLQSAHTDELKARLGSYAEQLSATSAKSSTELEQQLLQALLVYDDERIRIIELIPRIINLYEIDAELEQDMLNFRATLIKIVKELRPEITTLQRYKPYDFRIGISYAALMTFLQKQQDVRDRMLRDREDPDTILGQHSQRLQETYRAVKEAREQLEVGYRADTLKKQIDRIETELRRRQS